MQTTAIATRRPEKFVSEDRRVITRYLHFSNPERIIAILERVMRLGDEQVSGLLSEVMEDFSVRHRDVRTAFMDNFREVSRYLNHQGKISEERQLLIGSYFTLEYSIESAALFNPSIVAHPDQGGVADGCVRFLMSMRATGEGHISSIVFRRGEIDPAGRIDFDPPPRYAYSAKPVSDKRFSKRLFYRKLIEMGEYEDMARLVLDQLSDPFDTAELRVAIDRAKPTAHPSRAFEAVSQDMLWLARANYELRFPPDCAPAEIVIFPATENESRGMEDLRLVRFTDDDGRVHYYGTYTAFNGMRTLPMLMETTNFTTFHVSTLCGRGVRDKGMALFPRKINSSYTMISRQDGQTLFLMESDDLYIWNEARKLQGPMEPWELVQIGNCGSPLETEAGWVLLTHGVGPVRRYCIGAMLLDLDDPTRVIGRLRQPLLVPTPEEREGYVPNVVYSCGSMIHQNQLIIPYATADIATTFATVPVQELLDRLKEDGP